MPGHPTSSLIYQPFPQIPISPKGSFTQSFRFQPRRDGIDWRRFSAIDTERVARELDISTLQESINSITFCNLDNERCPYCQQPVDPVLLKVLKMAQFIIEYLLHCQECLSIHVSQLEERVEEAATEHQKTKDELVKVEEELKKVKEESRRRKKMIGTQQMLLQASANSYHKCQLCDKSFMNYSYLQGHIQRRHPEITESDRQKKKQVEQMEFGIEELKAKLQLTQAQLESEREIEHKRRIQELEEAHRREENAMRDFERWKGEERLKIQDEIDKMRQQFFSQLEDITLKNSTFENRFQDLMNKQSVTSNLGDLEDEEDRRMRQKMEKELRILRDEKEKQKNEWNKTVKELQKEHNVEKKELLNENKRLRASMSNDQRSASQSFEAQIQTLRSKMQDQKTLIKTQEKTIKDLTASREVHTEQLARVVQPVGGARDESSEDDADEYLDDTLKNIEALRSDPNFVWQFRSVLEEALLDKLESIGVKKGAKGIPISNYKSLKALLGTQLQEKINKYPEIETIKAKLNKVLTRRVKQRMKSEGTLQTPTSRQSVQRSPRGPHRTRPDDQLISQSKKTISAESHKTPTKTPVPSPRRTITGHQNINTITNVAPSVPPRTPPFTSEDDSSLMHTPKHKVITSSQSTQKVQRQEETYSDDDSLFDSDISPDKPSPRSVTFSTGSLVHSMARNLERQLSTPRQKPAGGVEIFNTQSTKTESFRKSANKADMHLSDMSDSDISSFDDVTDNLGINEPKPQPILRQSAESTGSQGTSLWSSSSIKAGGW
uniref:DAZ interacting zinc finger protein 1 like n=1 Tax=Leptobrachium leishanense TaxID=445787 RepID=A0A8C5MC61_9ANUR